MEPRGPTLKRHPHQRIVGWIFPGIIPITGAPGPLPGAANASDVTGARWMELCAGGAGRTRVAKLSPVTTRPPDHRRDRARLQVVEQQHVGQIAWRHQPTIAQPEARAADQLAA
jgi:hypothetical protein